MWQPRLSAGAYYRGAVAPATRSRRPLPRRVYWFRRLLVLGVAAVVVVGTVFGLAQLLDYSPDGSGGERATAVASAPDEPVDEKPRGQRPRKQKSADKRPDGKADKLAKPNGPCLDSDVLVTPTIAEAYAGSRVRIVLELTTVESAACYWEVSPDSVFVNIDGEEGTLWSSQHCSDAVPTRSVVPRRERAAKVPMWWDGRYSDEGCPPWSLWVEKVGSYTAVAAARGSVTPIATGFFLSGAVAETVTTTATPTGSPTGSPTRKPTEGSGERSGTKPAEPSRTPSRDED